MKDRQGRGLYIQSVRFDYYLKCNVENLETSKTLDEGNDQSCLWHPEAAHRSRFFISSIAENSTTEMKYLGTGAGENIQLTLEPMKNVPEEWKVEMDDDGCVTLFSTRNNRYVGSFGEDGKVELCQEGTENEEPGSWNLNVSPDGHFQFISMDDTRFLARDGVGSVKAIQLTDNSDNSVTLWKLEPCLPKDSSSGHEDTSSARMKALKTIGAAVSVAAIAPSLVMLSVGALGFGAGGIVGGSYAASMMSAQAVASGGGVSAGSMVATLQSIGAAGLGLTGTTVSMGTGGAVGGLVASAASRPSSGSQNTTAGSTIRETRHDPELLSRRSFSAWKFW